MYSLKQEDVIRFRDYVGMTDTEFLDTIFVIAHGLDLPYKDACCDERATFFGLKLSGIGGAWGEVHWMRCMVKMAKKNGISVVEGDIREQWKSVCEGIGGIYKEAEKVLKELGWITDVDFSGIHVDAHLSGCTFDANSVWEEDALIAEIYQCASRTLAKHIEDKFMEMGNDVVRNKHLIDIGNRSFGTGYKVCGDYATVVRDRLVRLLERGKPVDKGNFTEFEDFYRMVIRL